MKANWYVYELAEPDTGDVFYVGCGSGVRINQQGIPCGHGTSRSQDRAGRRRVRVAGSAKQYAVKKLKRTNSPSQRSKDKQPMIAPVGTTDSHPHETVKSQPQKSNGRTLSLKKRAVV